MASPAVLIAALDRVLQTSGEDVILQRAAGPTTPNVYSFTAPVRASVTGNSQTGVFVVIISPTDIMASGWPGPGQSDVGDERVPKITDTIVVQGRRRTISPPVQPKYVNGILVRITLNVST